MYALYNLQVFASTCAVNIKYFPFDIQTCTLTFVAYSYTTSSVYMSVGATGFDTGDTDGNPQWKIRSTSTSTYLEDGQVFVQFTIKLERKPEYYVINFILPIVMLSLLDIATFVLPCDSGEKSGYAITVFLSLAVYFSILSSQLPESSDVTSVFSVYVLVHALLSTMITLLCLCFIRVSSFDEKRNVPTCLRKLTIFVLRMNVNKTSNGEEIHKKSNIVVNEWIPKELEEPNVDWKNVVNALDIVCFCVFAFISFIVTVVCLTIYSSQT